ncbi:hypothetical protein BT67DRAFT_151114 [Trichocladium antarcticum]|uniref:Uncharacterized protein n=1 Tax=Trichocladium antarcticum TaxID=1450529 RepID=A0AAN6UEI4_9PEZI|nr:hypothetical protein BT67DRAFT_151114 [Trichocladium antarcticum]
MCGGAVVWDDEERNTIQQISPRRTACGQADERQQRWLWTPTENPAEAPGDPADTVRSPTGLSAATGWRGLCQCLGGSWVVGQPAKQSRRPRPFPRHKAREQRRRDVGMRDTYRIERANKDGAPSGRNGMWLMMPGQPDPIRSRNAVRFPASSLRPREADQFATDTFGAMVCKNEQSQAGADFCLLVGTDSPAQPRARDNPAEWVGAGGCGPGWSLDSAP